VAIGCKPLLDSDWAAITRLKRPTESLDAGGGSVFRIMIRSASLNEIAPARQVQRYPAWLVMLLITSRVCGFEKEVLCVCSSFFCSWALPRY
jgi:hypothetical protein